MVNRTMFALTCLLAAAGLLLCGCIPDPYFLSNLLEPGAKEQPANPPAQQPQIPAQPPADASQQKPATPVAENKVPSAFSYYGSACEVDEEGYPYRWQVDLIEDTQTNTYVGSVAFHNCPGGGRAVYQVRGPLASGDELTLTGDLKLGGGTLYNSAPKQETFTFNRGTGKIEPNLAP